MSVTGLPNTTVCLLIVKPSDVATFATEMSTCELVAASWVSSPAHVAQYV